MIALSVSAVSGPGGISATFTGLSISVFVYLEFALCSHLACP